MPVLPRVDARGQVALVTGAARGLGRAIAVALAAARFGRLDILVNNAGIAPRNPAEDVRETAAASPSKERAWWGSSPPQPPH